MVQLPDKDQSPWHQAHHKPSYPQLDGDLSVDVAVIGAGIAGLTTAYLLARSGQTVAVVEKQVIGGGTTGHTTGKVSSQHGITYASLAKRHGRETARLYGEANQRAVEAVEKIIAEEDIACDWQRDDNYVFTTDAHKVKAFKQEAETAAALGLPASFETDTALPFAVQAAVKFAGQAKIHASKYCLGLADAIRKKGGHVFEDSKVTRIHDGSPGRIGTRQGTVTAGHIVVATHVPTFPLAARVGYAVLEYPTELYAVAGKLQSDLSGMYISPDSGHYSILPIATGGDRLLVVVGAGGNLPGLRIKGSSKDRQQRLAQYAEAHFDIAAWQYRWKEYDYMAYDDLPLVGKLYPWSKNVYVATAFRKWGLSNGTAAGMILHDLITGRQNAWAPVFDSLRIKPVKSIPHAVIQFLKRNS